MTHLRSRHSAQGGQIPENTAVEQTVVDPIDTNKLRITKRQAAVRGHRLQSVRSLTSRVDEHDVRCDLHCLALVWLVCTVDHAAYGPRVAAIVRVHDVPLVHRRGGIMVAGCEQPTILELERGWRAGRDESPVRQLGIWQFLWCCPGDAVITAVGYKHLRGRVCIAHERHDNAACAAVLHRGCCCSRWAWSLQTRLTCCSTMPRHPSCA